MSRLTSILVLILAIIYITEVEARSACPRGEVFKSCGSACPPTCGRRAGACIQVCRQGCFCPNGQFRGPGGKCVSRCP